MVATFSSLWIAPVRKVIAKEKITQFVIVFLLFTIGRSG
jgi:hypothetical protein